MDANIEPDIYVMTRAWYGVVPIGAQAAVAIKMLTDTEAARDVQISSTQLALKWGGFGLKYVVYSGREPGEKASPDGVHVKLLGYKCDYENDILCISWICWTQFE